MTAHWFDSSAIASRSIHVISVIGIPILASLNGRLGPELKACSALPNETKSPPQRGVIQRALPAQAAHFDGTLQNLSEYHLLVRSLTYEVRY
jgi:hypothetical protein